jgi:hypothetical protein
VIVQTDDLQLKSLAGANYGWQGFHYDAQRRTATWTLAASPPAEPLVLTASDRVTDLWGNALDGNGNGLLLPSGDGVPGGKWTVSITVLPGDFRTDGQLDALDIDALAAAIQAGDPRCDLDGDGLSTARDIAVLVQNLMGTVVGDANLDGFFDSTDLVVLFSAGEFEDGRFGNSTWSTGDFNGDGEFDSSDLVFALQFGGYTP